jgi:hypothetical protein
MKYTIVPSINVLKKLNASNYVNHRDHFIVNKFGGKSFTKKQFIKEVKNYLTKRGNNDTTINYIPSQLFNWWFKRCAIFNYGEE